MEPKCIAMDGVLENAIFQNTAPKTMKAKEFISGKQVKWHSCFTIAIFASWNIHRHNADNSSNNNNNVNNTSIKLTQKSPVPLFVQRFSEIVWESSSHTLATFFSSTLYSVQYTLSFLSLSFIQMISLSLPNAFRRLTRTAAYISTLSEILFLVFYWHFNWRTVSSRPSAEQNKKPICPFVRIQKKAQLKEYKFYCCVPHRMAKVLEFGYFVLKSQTSHFNLWQWIFCFSFKSFGELVFPESAIIILL